MATPTYDLIDSQVLSTSAASVTFSSLDTLAAGYRDLIFVISGNNSGTAPKEFTVNGITSGIYSEVFVYSSGGTPSSDTYTNLTRAYMSRIINLDFAGVNILQIMDFAATDKHKPFLCRANAASSTPEMTAGRIGTTSAITSIEFGNGGADTWTVGVRFDLYGIAS